MDLAVRLKNDERHNPGCYPVGEKYLQNEADHGCSPCLQMALVVCRGLCVGLKFGR